jgi:hypothetical protein
VLQLGDEAHRFLHVIHHVLGPVMVPVIVLLNRENVKIAVRSAPDFQTICLGPREDLGRLNR